jgi:uncharacterized protein YecE (DUF72 family)
MIWIGTSGWQYGHWRERLYPTGVPQRAWLAHYARVFRTVEVNNSFYQLPQEATFDRWREESPPGFVFAVKASRYITHLRRLRDCGDPVSLFWSRAKRLGDKLGPVLFQLPPRFKADAELLESFLRVLPGGIAPAFEFRDDSWTNDQVFALLDRAGAAWVLADRPGWRGPLIVTGGWSYIRFHQGRRADPGYARAKLRTWSGRIASLEAKDVWIYFNNDGLGAAPHDALALAEVLADRHGLASQIARPAAA